MPFMDLLKALFSKPAPTGLPAIQIPPPAAPEAPAPVKLETPRASKPTPVTPPVSAGFSSNFERGFVHCMRWETGLKIDPKDPDVISGNISTPAGRRKCGYTDGISGASRYDSGGETKFGVAQRAHPELVVRTITLAQAMQVYKHQYWDAVRADELPADLAVYTFDIGVGSGPSRGIKCLQQALGVTADGAMGPATMAAVAACDQKATLERLLQIRINFYRSIVANNASQGIFLQGWLNRANDLS